MPKQLQIILQHVKYVQVWLHPQFVELWRHLHATAIGRPFPEEMIAFNMQRSNYYSFPIMLIAISKGVPIHYTNITWGLGRPKSSADRLFVEHLVPVKNKEIKFRITGSLRGETNGNRCIHLTKARSSPNSVYMYALSCSLSLAGHIHREIPGNHLAKYADHKPFNRYTCRFRYQTFSLCLIHYFVLSYSTEEVSTFSW